MTMKHISVFEIVTAEVIIAVVALFGGMMWWGLWMNHGYFGPLGILGYLLKANGEDYYDMQEFEMMLTLFLILSICYFSIRYLFTRAKRSSDDESRSRL